MKLSIIIPIYNSEETLTRCIKSISKQTLLDFEMLLVDDGSTDNSGRMADQLSLSDNRIKVIHKANGGLSDARNAGLSQAKGDYITFVDSDDEIAEGTLKTLSNTLYLHPEYDIIEYPVTERKGCPTQHIFMPQEKFYPEAQEWLAEFGLEHCWVCNKIFKRALIQNIQFEKGKKYEDVLFIGEVLLKKPKIYTTEKGMYIYHWNPHGIVAEKQMQALLDAQVHIVKLLDIHTKEKKWHRLYLNMLTAQLYAYCETRKIAIPSQKISIKKYRSNSDIIKALLLNLLGLRLTCTLFKLLIRK